MTGSRAPLTAVDAPSHTSDPTFLSHLRVFYMRRIAVLLASIVLVTVLAIWGSLVGVTDISLIQVVHRLFAIPLPVGVEPMSDQQWVAVSLIRAPRIVIAMLTGCALAAAGAMMQVITGNVMASPFTTGISSAAAFGASLAILSGWHLAGSGDLATIVSAFIAGGLCSILVFGIAASRHMGKQTIVLTGIAFSYLFSACSAALQFIADERELASIINWTFGSLNKASWPQIQLLAIVVTLGFLWAWISVPTFNLLAGGEESATAMGVDVVRFRTLTAIVITILAATAVSFTGVIGFVGLVAPHLARLMVGSNHIFSFPLAVIVGAGLVVAADLVGRLVASPAIIPVGIVISLIGVPIFVFLIIHRGEK